MNPSVALALTRNARRPALVVEPRQRPQAAVVITLGRLGLEGADPNATAQLLKQPKRLGVLLYLLLSQRGGALTRERVTATFWPESNADKARNALRQTLSFVRTCLGRDAIIGVGTHGLAVAQSLECDAIRFEALLDADRKEEALGLYGGELLPGFHVSGSSGFTEWLDQKRSTLSNRAAKAAWDLSAEREAEGDRSGAAFWGKRALSLSPFSESEVHRLLHLLDRVGDLSGALRAYHGLQQALRVEFGAVPSAETARLIGDIRKRHEGRMGDDGADTGRRLVTDRRVGERRRKTVARSGKERRVLADRRMRDRRAGRDRRADV